MGVETPTFTIQLGSVGRCQYKTVVATGLGTVMRGGGMREGTGKPAVTHGDFPVGGFRLATRSSFGRLTVKDHER